jgi:hypothetical protein
MVSRGGWPCQKDQHVAKELGFLATWNQPNLPNYRDGGKVGYWTPLMWPRIKSIMPAQGDPSKNSGHECLWYILTWRRQCILRTQKSHSWNPSRTHPICLFISLVPISVHYNKALIVRIVLYWVLWVGLENYLTWGALEILEFVARRSTGGLRTPKLAVGVQSEGSLGGACALNP